MGRREERQPYPVIPTLKGGPGAALPFKGSLGTRLRAMTGRGYRPAHDSGVRPLA